MSTPTLTRYGELPDGYDSLDPWKLDLAPERKALALSLTELFKSSAKPFVVAINAEWGTGKSLFLRMWHDHLLNEGLPCLIFNAWENDHAGTPLEAFLNAIRTQSKNSDSRIASISNLMLEKFKEIIPKAAKKGIELACSSIPGVSVGADILGEMVEKSVTSLFSQGDIRDSFRGELEDIACELCKDGKKPLIIMVDELDRCRPDFAIALLEDIKHLFSVDGVVFVLAVEKAQLANCITATYGLDTTGAHRYLGKFIDMTMELPPPDSKAFIKRLLLTYPLPDPERWTPLPSEDDSIFYQPKPCPFAELAEVVLSSFELSPRDLAQVLCRLSIIAHIPKIHPLAAVSCLILLGEIQRGSNMEEALRALMEDKTKSKMPIESEAYYDGILQKMLGGSGFHDLYGSLLSNTALSDKERMLYDDVNRYLRSGPEGLEWIQYLRSLILLIDNVTV